MGGWVKQLCLVETALNKELKEHYFCCDCVNDTASVTRERDTARHSVPM